MSAKVSEALWKGFVKKQKLAVELDDKDLTRALREFDKTDERKPDLRLQALESLIREVPRQVVALTKLKKALGDKSFGVVKDELYGILAEAEATRKTTQAALEAEQAGDDGEDEDAKPNALIDPKLLFKQLTLCRKDPERTVKFAYVDGKDKQPAMLALHPRMSERVLFGKLQAAAGVKTGAFGSAWIDGTSLMLQLDKPLSGLVKKARAPVRACGFRIARIVLWNADGTVFEQDEQDEPHDDAAGDGPSKAPAGPADADADAALEAQRAYTRRRAALEPRLADALADPTSDPGRLRAVRDFADGKATAGQTEAAMKSLDTLEKMLERAGAPGGFAEAGPSAPAAPVQPSVAYEAKLAALRPRVKRAADEGSPDAAKHRALMAFAATKAGDDNHPAALAALRQVEQLLDSPATPSAAAGGADPGAMFKARLTQFRDDMKAARSTGREVPLEASAMAAEAAMAAGQRDFERADRLLREAEDLLRRAPGLGAAETPRKPARPPAEPVAPIWHRAIAQALEQAMSLVVELRLLNDAEASRMADDLLDTLNDHMNAVGLTLEQYDDADDDERVELAANARDFLREEQSGIADDPLIAAADDNPFELKLEIRNTLHQALDEITAAFEA